MDFVDSNKSVEIVLHRLWDETSRFIRVSVYSPTRLVFWGKMSQDLFVCCYVVGLADISAQQSGAGTLV